MKTIAFLAIVAVLGLLYVRFAPIDPTKVHTGLGITLPGDTVSANRFVAARQITTSADGMLQAVDRVIAATPRTQRLAGDVAEGRLSYVTRSALFGFPDYTTVEVVAGDNGALLVIQGQAQFGASDIGVNRARIQGWLAELGPLIVPLP